MSTTFITQNCRYCEHTLKLLSDIHEFVHDMGRANTGYNSPYIATNVHELCHKSFSQNYSTSSTYVHDIHGDISVGSCNPLQVLLYVYEMHTTSLRYFYELLRVYKSSARSLACLYDSIRYITICYAIYARLVRQRAKLQTDIQCQRNFEIIFFRTYILSQKMQSYI